ncbi:related to GPI anchored cell wall protein [Ramularia collo-cygni]|uniref:Related to GPI anchored cell wall protein n=1 Tax=Ramularia collo-cygni TaxID=112498 RepID=A0A2D3V9J2_9PEZI|nr:related to GPI anchored cell wall protein [Ramularia collo-cygni]CZT20316.1 related to GPI anchored cell wall protein [Ramularia collo-cygni]
MKTVIRAAGLIIGASAAVVPKDDCCFQLTASGDAKGTIGQLGDGQNRIGGGYPPATYCINNGGITDKNGRGCILTPPTTQFQCDVGATPTYGFSIGMGGQVEYKGSKQFYACPATDNGEYNLYTTPAPGQAKCVKVTLSTGGQCTSGGAPKPSVPAEMPKPKNTQPAQPPKPSGTKPSPSEGGCPTALTGAYQTPHLIVPVSSKQPDTAYGTQYNATISPEKCTIFNFDIPSSYSGKKCSAVFLFPEQSQLQTSAYTFSGSGELVFSELSKPADQKTTFNNVPSKKGDLASIAIKPGNSYTVSSGSCAAGTTQSIEVCSAKGLSLEFFEDYNPSPLGLYITSC